MFPTTLLIMALAVIIRPISARSIPPHAIADAAHNAILGEIGIVTNQIIKRGDTMNEKELERMLEGFLPLLEKAANHDVSEPMAERYEAAFAKMAEAAEGYHRETTHQHV